MSITHVTDVCRLCLNSESSLIWVFAETYKFTEAMNEVIFQATGVKILKSDIISHMVCKKCLQFVILAYQFRMRSQQSDQTLKEKLKEFLQNNHIKISNSDTVIKTKDIEKKEIKDVEEKETEDVEKKETKNIENKEIKSGNALQKIHPSVTRLFSIHPNIKLPNICLKSHIDPFVSMQIDEVENYLKKKNLNIQNQSILKCLKASVQTPAVTAEKKSDKSLKKFREQPKVSNRESIDKPKYKSKHVVTDTQTDDKVKKLRAIDTRKDGKIEENQKNGERTVPPKSNVPNSRKRKLPATESSSQPGNKKPAVTQPFVSISDEKCNGVPIQLSIEKQVALHMCEICNSVQYSQNYLKRHMLKHLVCQFCKAKFKTMELKDKHIKKSCVIKNSNRLPDVKLHKIELDLEIRRKYPRAFVNFVPLPGLEKPAPLPGLEKPAASDNQRETANNKESDSNQLNLAPENVPRTGETAENALNSPTFPVIEIESDEEGKDGKRGFTPNTGTHSFDHSSKLLQMARSSNTGRNVFGKSSVRPNINIKNSNVFDNVDLKKPELEIVKYLLKNYRVLRMDQDKEVQTDLLTGSSIVTDPDRLSTELKYLKYQLLDYRIPVVMKNGPFKVSYNYDVQPKTTRKVNLWNDLIPIDIKVTEKRANITTLSESSTMNVVNQTECGAISYQPASGVASMLANNIDQTVDDVGAVDLTKTASGAALDHTNVLDSAEASENPLPSSRASGALTEQPEIVQNDVSQHSSAIPLPPLTPKPVAYQSVPEAFSEALNELQQSMSAPEKLAVYNGVLNNLKNISPNNSPTAVSTSQNAAPTATSTASSLPLPGIIRLKSVWELK